MSGGSSQVVVRIVKSLHNDTPSAVLEEAYQALSDMSETKWFPQEECLAVTTKGKQFIYVFEDFEGPAFEQIVKTGNRIYGPVCVLSCLKNGQALPREPRPVYSQAMEGVTVSCTSIDAQLRDDLHKYIQWMSGEVTKDFHQHVTHLVAGEVGTKKYLVAAKLKKKIMSPEWVFKVWEASRTSFVKAEDACFDKYRCPLFKGFVVTVSGLDSHERAQIKDMVTKEGGKYSGEMKINECTHLVLNKPHGQKYEFARQWKIHIVRPKWLIDSLDAGYCLEEQNYPVKSERQGDQSQPSHTTSTPTSRTKCRQSDIPDVSAISLSHINETNMTLLHNSTTVSLRNQSVVEGNRSMVNGDHDNQNATVVSGEKTIQGSDTDGLLAGIDLSKPRGDMFLDGCKIFFSGFKPNQLEKLRKIVNIGGGTRLSQFSENVSHVVLGEKLDSFLKQLQEATFRPFVVSVEWLTHSFLSGECAQEDNYLCLDVPSQDPTTPKAKSSRKSTVKQDKKPQSSSSDSFSRAGGDDTTIHEAPGEGRQEGLDDLLSQYLPENKESMGESTLMRAAEMGEQAADHNEVHAEPANQSAAHIEPANHNSSSLANKPEVVPQPANEDMDVTVDPDATQHEGLFFSGKSFVMLGFEAEDIAMMTQYLAEAGGKVLPANTRRVADYAVVPVFGFPVDITVNDVVTNAWLQTCLEQGKVLDLTSDPTFQPIDVVAGPAPLVDCVLSLSGYQGTERDVIIHMASFLGATVQDYFVRRANAAKNLKVSTHLVVNTAEGPKYTAANKWKLPAVTKHWIIQCAKQNKHLDESLFLVDRQTDVTLNHDTSLKQPTANSSPREDIPHRQQNIFEPVPEPKPDPEPMEVESHGGNDLNHEQQDMEADPQTTECRESQKENNLSRRGGNINAIPDKGSGSRENVLSNNRTNKEVPQVVKAGRYRLPDTPVRTNDPTVKMLQNKLPVTPAWTKNATSRTGKLVQNKLTETPKLVNNRVRELVADNISVTPKAQKPEEIDDVTPSKFLDPNRSYHPNFDFSDAMAALEPPKTPVTPRGTRIPRKKAVAIEDVFSYHLGLAVKNTEQKFVDMATPLSQRVRPARDSQEEEEEPQGPLHGVVIAVSKKLSTSQSEYNNIAANLGADYRWTYDRSCTHFIFQGRLNDPNKEFRLAKEQGKTIVSPHWLLMCQEQSCHVDESLFPHTFNPNLSLAVTPANTTRRSSRLTRNKSHKSSDETTSSDDPETSKRSKASNKSEPTKKLFNSLNTTQSDEEMAEVCHEAEEDVKETRTQALINDLQTLMAATKTYSKQRKSGMRRTDSFGNVFNDGNSSSRGATPGKTTDQEEVPAKKSRRSSKTSSKLHAGRAPPDTQTDASQMMAEVSWDDPLAREQQQILAHDLAKNSESFSPRPDHHEQIQRANLEHDDNAQDLDLTVDEVTFKKPARASLVKEEVSSTPEAPSIAFPLPRVRNSSSPPRPVELIDEAEAEMKDEPAEEDVTEKQRYFLMSGINPQERVDFGALVESLGGILLDTQCFDPRCTHLVVGNPSRNEKFLACVASGKWVLHKSYLEACRIQGKFVDEAYHEWGSASTASILQGATAQTCKLAYAANRWRSELQAKQHNNCETDTGAFHDWKVLLLSEKRREDGFRRLLEAGGGQVIATKLPSTDLENISHAFVDLHKVKLKQSDLEPLISAGVFIVKPEYIAGFLMDQPIKPSDYYIPELVPLMKNADVRKRKASGEDAPGTPKSKRYRR